MGTVDSRRAVQVPESTWRKAKIIAAALGVPISAIVTSAIEEYARHHAENVSDELKGGEHDPLQDHARTR